MQEKWCRINEFPGYQISTFGNVRGYHPNHYLKWAYGRKGFPTVSLVLNGRNYTRSVPMLVARHWLPEPMREDFNTPIHLDGDRTLCHVENLMWRPRWFAISYHKERIEDPFPLWKRPIEIIETQEIFDQPRDCAMQHGVLEWGIFHSIYNDRPIFPYRFNARLVR